MINRSPELFSQPPIRSDFSRHRMDGGGRRRFAVLLIPVLLFAGLVWGYFEFADSETVGEIPTIKGDSQVKQRPDQPGGLEIPHQDMLVFQQIENNENAPPQVEHLLPSPETPQAQAMVNSPPPVQQPVAAPEVAPVKEAVAPVAAPAPVVEPQPIAPTTTVISPQPAPKTDVPAKATTVVPKQEVVGKLPKELFMMNSGKTSAVQLASINDEAIAKTEMQKLQNKYSAQLGKVKLRLVKADLAAKGIYYRVQSEALPESEAKSLCAALKTQKTGCIVVHP
ncbi:MAG: SPOR domain-containing protein [Alphaproteobacteria bacterium]|nr:SPOR domain-containing protein [Alphaproteobacteria bacterium]